MKQFQIRVRGTVQGVFFRKYCQEKADELGLSGWCQNETDGSVQIVVEGAEEVLEHFLGWCYQGSPASDVEQVEVEERPVEGLEDFQIRSM